MKRVLVFLALLALLPTCRERFEAEQVYKPGNILVVEGFINVGPGITLIKLSRVTPLDGVIQQNPAGMELVALWRWPNTSYTCTISETEVYESDELNLWHRPWIPARGWSERPTIRIGFLQEPIISPRIDGVSWTRSADDYITVP